MKNIYSFVSLVIAALLVSLPGWTQDRNSVATPKTVPAASDQDSSGVATGFGILVPKTELTSAIGILSGEALSRNISMNPLNTLYGKIPGLSVMENGGAPWAGPRLFIRGLESTRDNSILTLVDGFERPLSSLTTQEIKSIAVLKDGAALAKFGMRGAGGVILVTTKDGSGPGSKFNVSYEHGIQKAFRLPDFLDAYSYASAVNEALANDGLSPRYSDDDLAMYQKGNSPYFYPNVNWFDETMRQFGSLDRFDFTFQNKRDRSAYFLLFDYQNMQGLFGPVHQNDGYSTQYSYAKFNFRSNISFDLTKTTRFVIHLSGNLNQTRAPRVPVADIMHTLYTTPSAAFPVKTFDDVWGGTDVFPNNPRAMIQSTGYRSNKQRQLFADGSLKQRLDFITPGLSAEVAIAYDNSATYYDNYVQQYQYETISRKPSIGDGYYDTVRTLHGENTALAFSSDMRYPFRHATYRGKLNYDHLWEGGNRINATLLYQQDKLVEQGQNNVFLHQLAMGQAHYAHAEKYFADLSLSYSGTGILPKGHRFGLFPALSFGWKLSNEPWFHPGEAVNDLKLRASFGMAGADDIPRNMDAHEFNYSAPYWYTSSNAVSPGMAESQLPSADPRAEVSSKYNFGIDAGFFHLLNLNIDAFFARRRNITVNPSGLISDVIGINKPLESIGVVDNKGLEINLEVENQKSDFQYDINGQFSFSRNKIIEMGEAYQPYDYMKSTGKPVGQAKGYVVLGFFKDQAEIDNSPRQLFSEVQPGDIQYQDLNKDGVIDDFDQKNIGYSTAYPEINYALSLDFSYKGLGVYALFQGVRNYSVMLNTESVYWPLRGNTSTISSYYYDHRWTEENPGDALFPKLTTLENSNNFRNNSLWMADGSYLKLRMIEVYYKFNTRLIEKQHGTGVQVFLRGKDIFSLDHIHILDPESTGIAYPTLTSFSAGFEIGF